jgi:SPP1 gp7 family putative phage head morphogenesis protein
MAFDDADLDEFEEAVRRFRMRVPISDVEWDQLLESEREYAFKVAGVSQARMVQEVYDAVERAVRDGTTLDDFKAEAGPTLTEAWGANDSARMETVFRNGVMSSYNAGRWDIFTEPHVLEERPYFRFDAAVDNRTTDLCDALDGTILPADHPFWRTSWPPLHPNCRSTVIPLTESEARAEGISPGPPDTRGEKPTPGFGRAPSGTGRDWKPDLDNMPPALRDALEEKLD